MNSIDQNQSSSQIIIKPVPDDVSNIRQFYEFESLTIATQEDLSSAGMKLTLVKDRLKKAKALRDRIIVPIRDAMKKQDEVFQEVIKPLTKIEAILKDKIGRYMDKIQEELDYAKKIELESQKKQLESKASDLTIEAMSTGSNVALEAAGKFQKQAEKIDTENVFQRQNMNIDGAAIIQRKVWKWKVVDPTLIPRSLLIVDEKQLNAMTRSYGESKQVVPGIEFYEETSLSVKV